MDCIIEFEGEFLSEVFMPDLNPEGFYRCSSLGTCVFVSDEIDEDEENVELSYISVGELSDQDYTEVSPGVWKSPEPRDINIDYTIGY